MLTPRLHRALSFRAALLLLLPVLTAITGVALNVRSYLFARDTVTHLSHDLFDELSKQVVGQTQAHLRQAQPAVELGRLWIARGLDTHDRRALGSHLLAMLDANPSFSWMSFGAADGTFVGAHRIADGERRVNTSWIEPDGRTRLEEFGIGDDDAWVLDRVDDDHGYDPRRRPYYAAAIEAGESVWLDPYVFYDQGIPGITFAAPVDDAEGAPLGVVTVDFDLNVLSDVVRSLAPSEHGQTFLFTGDGALVGHPSVSIVERRGAQGEGELVSLEEVRDPITQGFVAALGARVRCAEAGEHGVAFESGGASLQGLLRCFEIDRDHYWGVGVVAPESDFLGGVREDILRGVALSLFALFASVLLAFFLAERVARPLRDVSMEMDAVGRFDLRPQPSRESRFAEIRSIERSLHGMKSGLRSFAAFVPQGVVRNIVESGEEARLGGELREITLFFSDLAGFTTMSERMEPDELVQRLGTYLEEVTAIIQRHGGTVDKFIGDAVMAFWGAPHASDDHAAAAVRAAMEIQARLRALSETEDGAWMRTTHTRIGIATGVALVGNVGTPTRMNYTAMGDVVNLAARLEGLNKQYGTRLMISASTRDACGEGLVCRAIDVVAVKGKREGTRVYEPLGEGDEITERDRRVADLSERALDAYLGRAFDAAVDAWREVLALRPGDAVAARMLEQARSYAASPPPEDWSGVHFAMAK